MSWLRRRNRRVLYIEQDILTWSCRSIGVRNIRLVLLPGRVHWLLGVSAQYSIAAPFTLQDFSRHKYQTCDNIKYQNIKKEIISNIKISNVIFMIQNRAGSIPVVTLRCRLESPHATGLFDQTIGSDPPRTGNALRLSKRANWNQNRPSYPPVRCQSQLWILFCQVRELCHQRQQKKEHP